MNFSIAKRLILLIVTFLFLVPFDSFGQNRPKVGLVLSGGGAKGFAHIEILKMLDDGMDYNAIKDGLDISKGYITKVKKSAVKDGLLTANGSLTQTGFLYISEVENR